MKNLLRDLMLRHAFMALQTRDAGAAGRRQMTLDRLNDQAQPLRVGLRGMEVRKADKESRTVEVAFSSDNDGLLRWFGYEVLSHQPGAIRLERLQDGAAFLMDHNSRDQVGVVESVEIGADGVGRASIRFGRSSRAQEIFQDVQDGIRKHISVGYRIHAWEITGERDGEDVVTITDWEPYEISLVAVPFDPTVGVGRSLEIPQEEQREEKPETDTVKQIQLPETKPAMNIKILRDASGNLVRAEVDADGNIVKIIETLELAGADVRSHASRGQADERGRVASILELGKRFGANDEARAAISEGKTVDQFQGILLERTEQRAKRPLSEQSQEASIGMTDNQVRQFSFLKAVRALAPNATAADRQAAAFEFECSAEAQRVYGKPAQGILIPVDVLSRAFNAGGAANSPTGAQTGQLLVQNTTLTGSFIDMLRNRTTAMRLGTTMAGLVGTVDIPKQTGGATGYWVGEGEDATEGSPTLGQITFSPKTVAAMSEITRRLMMQSTPDAESIVRRDLNNALAQTIDYAAYYGSGSDKQPRGLKNYSGINAVDFATSGGAGTYATPTFAELVQMETEIAADNADINQMGYVAHSRFRGHCKTTPKFGSGTESTIWESGNTVNGYRTEITNQVAATDVFFGNFADFIIAMWGGLDLTVDPYSLSKSGGLRLVVFQDVDMNLRRVESVCWGSHLVS